MCAREVSTRESCGKSKPQRVPTLRRAGPNVAPHAGGLSPRAAVHCLVEHSTGVTEVRVVRADRGVGSSSERKDDEQNSRRIKNHNHHVAMVESRVAARIAPAAAAHTHDAFLH